MSQENLEIVRRAVNALNEGDVDGYLALCSADIELASPVASIEGANKGADGIREFFSGVREAMNIFRVDVEKLRALDNDRVLAFVQVSIESKGGIALTQAGANLYELAGGKLRRVRVYLDRNQALEAAGLRE